MGKKKAENLSEFVADKSAMQVNPVIDPSAALTDPADADFKPQNRTELHAALQSMIQGSKLSPEEAYEVVRQAFARSEERMNKVEEAIRKMIKNVLAEVTTVGDLRMKGAIGIPDIWPNEQKVSDTLAAKYMSGAGISVPAGVSGIKKKEPEKVEEPSSSKIEPGAKVYGQEDYEKDVKWLQQKLGKEAKEAIEELSPEDVKKNLMGEFKVKYAALILKAGGDPGSLGMVDRFAKGAVEKYQTAMKVANATYDEGALNRFAMANSAKAREYPRIAKSDIDLLFSWMAQEEAKIDPAAAESIREVLEEEPTEEMVDAARDELKKLVSTESFKKMFDEMVEEAVKEIYEQLNSSLDKVLQTFTAKYKKDSYSPEERKELLDELEAALEGSDSVKVSNMTGMDADSIDIAQAIIASTEDDTERMEFIENLIAVDWMPEFREKILQKYLLEPTVKKAVLSSIGVNEDTFKKYADALIEAQKKFLEFLDEEKRAQSSSSLPSAVRRRRA